MSWSIWSKSPRAQLLIWKIRDTKARLSARGYTVKGRVLKTGHDFSNGFAMDLFKGMEV